MKKVVAVLRTFTYIVRVMKNITETKVRSTSSRARRERNCNWHKGVLFVDDIGSDMLDTWFSENGIRNLDYKCATWNWLVKEHSKIIRRVVRAFFGCGEEFKLSWNAHAGCSCPCSPGYIVSSDAIDCKYPHFNHWCWMDVKLEESDLAEIKQLITVASYRLRKEKEKREAMLKPDVELNLT